MTYYKLLSLAIVVLAMPMQAIAVSPEEFIHAATWEDNETVRRALEENIDPDIADKWGNSALMLAASDGNDEMLQLLLDHGAKVDTQARDGATALMLAAQESRLSSINILLQHGAGLELRNSSKETALLVAINEDRYAEAKRLVDAGANVDVANIHRRTALLLAAKSLDMTRYLVEHGADVNGKSLLGGYTPVALLRRGGDYEDVIAYLESRGARNN